MSVRQALRIYLIVHGGCSGNNFIPTFLVGKKLLTTFNDESRNVGLVMVSETVK